jgi:hypothetical protein
MTTSQSKLAMVGIVKNNTRFLALIKKCHCVTECLMAVLHTGRVWHGLVQLSGYPPDQVFQV